jgi:ubiquinone/menaquinone biosynthesis C-methylase UbiE
MENVSRDYLPAAGHDWALPFYDPLVKLLGAEAAKRALLDQAAMRAAHRVLDIGCGTGTLTTLAKLLYPDANVVGLDPDPKALARAQRKARRSAVSIRFDRGSSDQLPYPDASFDRVLSSFMFHHLRREQRERTLGEVRRVLAPGGSLHLLDFDRPDRPAAGLLARWIQSSPHFSDSSEQRILALMRQSGFVSSTKVMTRVTLLGLLRMGYYQASVQGAPEKHL